LIGALDEIAALALAMTKTKFISASLRDLLQQVDWEPVRSLLAGYRRVSNLNHQEEIVALALAMTDQRNPKTAAWG